MERKILECINQNPSREHILPFFWQHGEDHEVIREEIDAIFRCSIREFCVESRVHEQFCEEKWWMDFEFILREAKKREMRVWLLDDKYFPTGYANNYIAAHPELRITSLRVAYYDYVGPQKDMAIIPALLDAGEAYVSVVAYRRMKGERELCGEGVELLSHIENGLLWWDIPEGVWRIYYVIRTCRVCSPDKVNYIDMLSEESCKAMLHAVYEPHYEHFSEYFGNTFAGFFSDEPSFSNDVNNYQSILGKEDMLLPWKDDLPTIMAEKSGRTREEICKLLPGLWHEIEGQTPLVRECYMEVVTEKYRHNFSYLLGDWCRAHNVMYIGHMIEDMNTHQRLGYGAGHFFRALDGQDMGGMDIVLNQIIPGHTELSHTADVFGHTVDPEFYRYTLAKLASSHSHIQPLKQNRAMCEIFGAFGWAEGVPTMKYLVDHMLVSGINYFVPHAFNPKYPDPDCPPHFYANGTNPQYPAFGELMEYTARMTHVLTGGVHRADVAVYYNAEAEWAGGNYMLQQKVCKVLTRNQIDFDLIPQDTLVTAEVERGSVHINEETYGALIVPYSQYLPERVVTAMDELAKKGVLVVFLENLPDKTSEMKSLCGKLANCSVVTLSELGTYLIHRGYRSVNPESVCPALRFYHIERGEYHLFTFWNEDMFHEIDTMVTLPAKGQALLYDGWSNRVFAPQQEGSAVRISLAPEQTVVICVGDLQSAVSKAEPYSYGAYDWKELSPDWEISIREAKENGFVPYRVGGLSNLARELSDFAGVIRYDAVCHLQGETEIIDLGRVGEIAQLWVNEQYCGMCVSAPFRFDVRGILHTGENRIRVEIMNNLGYKERDRFSLYLPLPPTGLLGPVQIGKTNKKYNNK